MKINELYLPINLSFFDEGEKTEQPTARKRHKAREEGQVAKSQEASTAALFLGMFFSLRFFAPGMIAGMRKLFAYNFSLLSDIDEVFTETFIPSFIAYLFSQVLLIVMPIFLVALVIGVIVNIVQVGWHPTTKPLMPKFNKLNPVSGFKRLFSLSKLTDLFKALAKLGVIITAIYFVLSSKLLMLPSLIDMSVVEGMAAIGNISIDLGLMVGWLFVFIAGVDIFYTRFKHTKQLKMTKAEVKEEHKMTEGNPQIKSKIRQKMREVSMRRMMHEVPNADVIITNPTHYAVALKYDKDSLRAPVVVAKGVDYVAQRIKERAKEYNVEIVENKELARSLYSLVDIGREIPPELYQAVAEILAFVFKIKNKV